MLQLTSRDEAMLDWMNVVRLADVDAIRWALSAYQDNPDGPVSVRRANHWIARMAELGYVGRTRPVYRDRQIVWPTYQASGRSAPRLFRQTMRHEIAVATIAGFYLSRGFEWGRDQERASSSGHQADGVARRSSTTDIVEVELTPKVINRYGVILQSLGRRLEEDQDCRVVYYGTQLAMRMVEREADRLVFRGVRSRLLTSTAFDVRGKLVLDCLMIE